MIIHGKVQYSGGLVRAPKISFNSQTCPHRRGEWFPTSRPWRNGAPVSLSVNEPAAVGLATPRSISRVSRVEPITAQLAAKGGFLGALQWMFVGRDPFKGACVFRFSHCVGANNGILYELSVEYFQ